MVPNLGAPAAAARRRMPMDRGRVRKLCAGQCLHRAPQVRSRGRLVSFAKPGPVIDERTLEERAKDPAARFREATARNPPVLPTHVALELVVFRSRLAQDGKIDVDDKRGIL